MQKHTLKAQLLQLLVLLKVAVFVVTRDRMPLASQVHTNLGGQVPDVYRYGVGV